MKQRLWVGLLAMGAAGCAIQTPHLAINRYPVAQQAAYYPEALPGRLGVMPLADQRPPQERQGRKPPGIFLLLWNRRTGDYYTGDRIFGEPVAPQLSQGLVDYLQAAHVFTETVSVPASAHSPTALQRLGDEHAADYLLGGEWHHFFGSQHQQCSMFILPLYFINTWGWSNGKSLPWGQTTALLVLYQADTGELVWRAPIEQTWTMPRDTDSMAEAAMKSFTATAAQLATQLRQLSLAAPPVSSE